MSEGFHQAFAGALRTGDMAGLADWLPGQEAQVRFAVYRNNVVRGAIEALRSAYPAVNTAVGANFFSPMAKSYWEARPPQMQTMTLYGAGFADHIAIYAPAAGLPYLGDIARLDRAWLEAHHAAESAPLDPAQIAEIPPADLPGLLLSLHPSVRLLTLGHEVADMWAAGRAGRAPESRTLAAEPQYLAVWRQRGSVRHEVLDASHHQFLTTLSASASLAEGLEAAAPHGDDAFAGRVFAHGLSQGLFITATP